MRKTLAPINFFQIAGIFCDAVSLSNWPWCEGWCGWWWPEQSCSPSIWSRYKCQHLKGPSNANKKQSLIPLFWFKSITTYGSINNKTSHSPCLLHFFTSDLLGWITWGRRRKVPAVMKVSNKSNISCHCLPKFFFLLFNTHSISTRDLEKSGTKFLQIFRNINITSNREIIHDILSLWKLA